MTGTTPRPLMVLGTSSGAGKSLMTAALCRVLQRRGEQALPFNCLLYTSDAADEE